MASSKPIRITMSPLPILGRQDLVLNWDGSLALVIETTDVKIRKFYEVEEDFAPTEGENDTGDGWWPNHRAYF